MINIFDFPTKSNAEGLVLLIPGGFPLGCSRVKFNLKRRRSEGKRVLIKFEFGEKKSMGKDLFRHPLYHVKGLSRILPDNLEN